MVVGFISLRCVNTSKSTSLSTLEVLPIDHNNNNRDLLIDLVALMGQ